MRYFITASESIATRSDPDWVAPEGWSEISAKLHATLAAEQATAIEELLAEKNAANAARRDEDYRGLLAAGVPENVARRLSGTVA